MPDSQRNATTDVADLTLIAFEASGTPPVELRPAPLRREWMDATDQRFAYRCLPLVIASQLGWEALCPAPFAAIWNGGPRPSDVTLEYAAEDNPLIESHFGYGILTFKLGYLFRTSPGHNIWVKGPANRPKDGIAPLEGVVESDWGPFTFTMNWQFTRPNHAIGFERGEPFAALVPYPRHYAARFAPEIRPIATEPELEAAYNAWRDSRNQFNEDLEVEGSKAQDELWQRHYMRGTTPEGTSFPDHERRVPLRPFVHEDTEETA